MRNIATWLVVLALAATVACGEKKAKDKNEPQRDKQTTVAKVEQPAVKDALADIGGRPISKAQFLEYLKPYPARMKGSIQGREYVLQAMIDQILLEEEARRRGLDQEPEFVAKVDAYRRNLLNNRLLDTIKQGGFEVTLEEAKKYFQENPDEFDRPEKVNIRHILVATEPEAKDLLAQVRKGGNFEELARKHSLDNFSKDRGGELGPFSKKQRPDLAEAAFKLSRPGALSGPIKSPRGFHVLQLIARTPAQKDKFEDIQESLVNRLRARRRQEAKKNLLASVREKAEIQIDQEALKALEIQ